MADLTKILRPRLRHLAEVPGQRTRHLIVLLVLALVGAVVPFGSLSAQQIKGQGGEEIQLLRDAAAAEAAGDLEEAEAILAAVLEGSPGSLNAILAYERVLRAQGRLARVLPAVERLLEADPGASVGRQVQLRALSFLGRVDELEAAGRSWIEHNPRLETPYREVAEVWRERGELGRAVAILEEGRSRLGRDDALALELGTLHLERGELVRAAAEWDLAIGPDARGLSLVRRRLNAMSDGGALLLPALIERLIRSPTSVARQRAAAELALDAGLEARAEAIAHELTESLSPEERARFLIDVARRSDGARLRRLAYWAYGRLLEDHIARATEARADEKSGEDARELLAIRARLGELALALGDTVAAGEHYRVVEQAYAIGSPERRQATAVRIELMARDGHLDEAYDALEDYRREFPQAPELDALVAVLGEELVARGDTSRARLVARGVDGPRATLLRARMALRDGDIAGARAGFMAAAPKLDGREATEVIALVALLGRLSAEGGALIGRAMSAEGRDGAAESIAILVEGSSGLDRAERSALLEFAAKRAEDAGLIAEAERVRRIQVAELPEMRETPSAILALARMLADRPGGVEEARELLEILILDHPRSALTPQARSMLQSLNDR